MLDVKKLFTKILEAIKPLRWQMITSGSADLNDYRTEGRYYFSTGASLSNTPNGATNGWLQVFPSNSGVVRQMWYRTGSGNGSPATYTDLYERVYGSSAWLAWERITTGTLLSNTLASYVPTSRTVNGHALTGNISVTLADLKLAISNTMNAMGFYLTSGNYPYLRWTDTGSNQYQLVTFANGLRYQTLANGETTWSTPWTIEGNNAVSVNAATTSVTNSTDTTLCNTASLSAGTYIIIGTGSFASNATGRRALFFSTSNTGGVINRYSRTTVPPTSGGITQVQVMMLANFTSATTVYLRAYQNSGGALNVTDAGIQTIKLHS